MNNHDNHPTTPHKPPLAYEALRDVIDLALWAGQMLMQGGAESQRVEETVHRLGTGLGCDWMDVLVSPNAIVVTTTSGNEFRTKTRRVVRLGVNLWMVSAVNRLSRRVNEEKLDRFQVRSELERIDATAPQYPRWLVAGMVGVGCAAFSRLFGGDWPIFAVTFVAAFLTMLLRQELQHWNWNPLLTVVVCAFVGGVLAGSAVSFGMQPEVGLISAVLLLVPGVHLLTSAEDLLQGHLVTGLVRGVHGLLISLAIAMGLLLALGLIISTCPTTTASFSSNCYGLQLASAATNNPPPPIITGVILGEDALWSGLAAMSFAMAFNVPRRALLACALGGAAGHVLRTFLLGSGWSIELSTFVGAAVIGILAQGFARFWQAPALVFTVPGVIPMVPGSFAFRTMINILEITAGTNPLNSPLLIAANVNFIKTGFILLAIAVGIAGPMLIINRQKPVA